MDNKFSEKQIEDLCKPLNRANVKNRKQGGRTFSYIEGWLVIDEANRIFGFDAWSRETIYCKEVSRVEVKIGEQKKGGWKVGYEAKVRITVGSVIKEGTGHGCGSMTDLFDCIESACKEAETDAMKRALMMFGNPFGLALYDKQQRNVEDESAKRAAEAKAKAEEEKKKQLAENLIPIPEESDVSGVRDWRSYTRDVIVLIKNCKNFTEFNNVRVANKDGLEFLTMADEKLRAEITEASKQKAASFKAPEKPPVQ